MTTRYIHSLNRSRPIMLSIARADTAGSRSGGEEPAVPGGGGDSGTSCTHEESCGSRLYGCGG
ncbi:hypothetical protein ACFVHW_13845 [Streptomyces sp. NPDC127110]|uniref:hypothetical protein n=1 Tax=Streptomyces sp. NPDC127110 TaxID=3345362 RepID=UPI0036424EFE